MTNNKESAKIPVRMTVSEAARRIGVCPQTVRNLAHDGRLDWFWGTGTERPSGIVSDSVRRFIDASVKSESRRAQRTAKGSRRG